MSIKEEDEYANGNIYPISGCLDVDDLEIDIREDRFTIYELIQQLEKKFIIINPEIQKNHAWEVEQASYFIESIMLKIPLSPIFFNQNRSGQYIAIDGTQRITAITSFIAGEFKLTGLKTLSYLNGRSYHDLEEKIQARIEDCVLRFHIIKPQVKLAIVYDILKRINTPSTPLNLQEIRHCL